MQASDVVFADDDGCLFVKSENVDELLATARTIWGERQQEKRLRLDARCAHNWTSPVTARSEQPIPVTHFAITCETSTAPFSTSFDLESHNLTHLCAGGLHPLHPDIDPTSSTRLGSSLTISGARQGRRWL